MFKRRWQCSRYAIAKHSRSLRGLQTSCASGFTAAMSVSNARVPTKLKRPKWSQRGKQRHVEPKHNNSSRQSNAQQVSQQLSPEACSLTCEKHGRRTWKQDRRSSLQNSQPNHSFSGALLKWMMESSPESLAEVARQQEEASQTDDTTQADFVREGSRAVLRVKRMRVKSTMPATTEQLRHKYRLLAVHWGMLCQRYPNKSWATGYQQSMLRSHVDWLLGDDVAELKAMTPAGHESICPAWPVVLRYELEVRKEAMRQLNMCGASLATAFAAGRQSDELRTRYLVSPLALGRTPKRLQETRPAVAQQPKNRKAPQNKGAGKRSQEHTYGKGQQRGRSDNLPSGQKTRDTLDTPESKGAHLVSSTCGTIKNRDASPINQSPHGCSRGESCAHQHICAHCFGPHSFEHCPNFSESRAAYLKKRLSTIRLKRESRVSSVSSTRDHSLVAVPVSKKEGSVVVTTLPTVYSDRDPGLVAVPVSQKEGSVGVPTLPAVLSAHSPGLVAVSASEKEGSVGVSTLPAVLSPLVSQQNAQFSSSSKFQNSDGFSR